VSRIIPFERCLSPTFEAPEPKPIRRRPEVEREPERRTAPNVTPCGADGCDGFHHHPVKLKADPFGFGLMVPTKGSYCPESEWFKFWKETL